MVLIPFIVMAVAAIALIEVPRMRRMRLKKELWSFSLLLALGTALCAAKALGANVKSPLAFITFIFKPMSIILQKLMS